MMPILSTFSDTLLEITTSESFSVRNISSRRWIELPPSVEAHLRAVDLFQEVEVLLVKLLGHIGAAVYYITRLVRIGLKVVKLAAPLITPINVEVILCPEAGGTADFGVLHIRQTAYRKVPDALLFTAYQWQQRLSLDSRWDRRVHQVQNCRLNVGWLAE